MIWPLSTSLPSSQTTLSDSLCFNDIDLAVLNIFQTHSFVKAFKSVVLCLELSSHISLHSIISFWFLPWCHHSCDLSLAFPWDNRNPFFSSVFIPILFFTFPEHLPLNGVTYIHTYFFFSVSSLELHSMRVGTSSALFPEESVIPTSLSRT